MGWKLAEEVAWARPDRPGPEWWTLMDLAQDARDSTRQTMCGVEYLMSRSKCSKRTVYRRLDALRENKLIEVVRHAAPGQRAIYEISDALFTLRSGDSVSDTRSGDSVSDTRSGDSVSDTRSAMSLAERVSESNGTGVRIGETGDSVNGTHAVTAPSYNPVNTPAAVVPPSVEVPEPAELNGAARQPIEQQAWLALHSRM